MADLALRISLALNRHSPQRIFFVRQLGAAAGCQGMADARRAAIRQMGITPEIKVELPA